MRPVRGAAFRRTNVHPSRSLDVHDPGAGSRLVVAGARPRPRGEDPRVRAGRAGLADPNYGVCYPPAWFIPADLLIVLHLLFGALGVALLARRWGAPLEGEILAGGAFLACGYTQSIVVQVLAPLTIAWTPWIAVAADRLAERPGWRRAIPIAAATGAQLLSREIRRASSPARWSRSPSSRARTRGRSGLARRRLDRCAAARGRGGVAGGALLLGESGRPGGLGIDRRDDLVARSAAARRARHPVPARRRRRGGRAGHRLVDRRLHRRAGDPARGGLAPSRIDRRGAALPCCSPSGARRRCTRSVRAVFLPELTRLGYARSTSPARW